MNGIDARIQAHFREVAPARAPGLVDAVLRGIERRKRRRAMGVLALESAAVGVMAWSASLIATPDLLASLATPDASLAVGAVVGAFSLAAWILLTPPAASPSPNARLSPGHGGV